MKLEALKVPGRPRRERLVVSEGKTLGSGSMHEPIQIATAIPWQIPNTETQLHFAVRLLILGPTVDILSICMDKSDAGATRELYCVHPERSRGFGRLWYVHLTARGLLNSPSHPYFLNPSIVKPQPHRPTRE